MGWTGHKLKQAKQALQRFIFLLKEIPEGDGLTGKKGANLRTFGRPMVSRAMTSRAFSFLVLFCFFFLFLFLAIFFSLISFLFSFSFFILYSVWFFFYLFCALFLFSFFVLYYSLFCIFIFLSYSYYFSLMFTC